MSFKEIKEELYTQAESMTIANGFNYDWVTGRRADLSYKNDAVFIIEYPDTEPFESNNDEAGGISSFQYRNIRKIYIIGRVKSDLTTVILEDIIDKNNDALDKALQDLKKKFCGKINNTLCENGVIKIDYGNAYKREIESKGVYYPYELLYEMTIEYTEQRC